MAATEHPFKPGTIVAVRSAHHFSHRPPSWKNHAVEKVHKNGRFVLAGSPQQQWNAWPPRENGADSDRLWHAVPAGESRYSGRTVFLIDESSAPMIRKGEEEDRAHRRLMAVQEKIERLRYADTTPEMLTGIEDALQLTPKETPDVE